MNRLNNTVFTLLNTMIILSTIQLTSCGSGNDVTSTNHQTDSKVTLQAPNEVSARILLTRNDASLVQYSGKLQVDIRFNIPGHDPSVIGTTVIGLNLKAMPKLSELESMDDNQFADVFIEHYLRGNYDNVDSPLYAPLPVIPWAGEDRPDQLLEHRDLIYGAVVTDIFDSGSNRFAEKLREALHVYYSENNNKVREYTDQPIGPVLAINGPGNVFDRTINAVNNGLKKVSTAVGVAYAGSCLALTGALVFREQKDVTVLDAIKAGIGQLLFGVWDSDTMTLDDIADSLNAPWNYDLGDAAREIKKFKAMKGDVGSLGDPNGGC